MAHEMVIEGSDRCFVTWFQETDWNGTPAYIKYIRDVTEEVHNRREKERLAMYFQTVLESLPGGISVIRCGQDGSMKTEYISDGFAAMTHMTVEEAMKLYETDIFAGSIRRMLRLAGRSLRNMWSTAPAIVSSQPG